MSETEDKIEQEEAARLEIDRQKWIIDRKRQRAHFRLLKEQMIRLGKKSDIDVADEIWKNYIEPKLDKQE